METFSNIYPLMALGYTGYFIISYIYNLIKINTLVDTLNSFKAFKLINTKHISGILLFGTGFWVFFSDFLGSILLLITIIISAFLSKKSASKYFWDLDTSSIVKFREQILYFSIRIPFLFFYELFFRGILLHSSLIFTNLIGAIFINLILYTLIHSFNSRREIIGCIPFGTVLCLFSYYTNSIWPAFLIHTTLSFMYESTLFKITSLKTQKS
jgi:membrane protease YdiL (CAAX protease family)